MKVEGLNSGSRRCTVVVSLSMTPLPMLECDEKTQTAEISLCRLNLSLTCLWMFRKAWYRRIRLLLCFLCNSVTLHQSLMAPPAGGGAQRQLLQDIIDIIRRDILISLSDLSLGPVCHRNSSSRFIQALEPRKHEKVALKPILLLSLTACTCSSSGLNHQFRQLSCNKYLK